MRQRLGGAALLLAFLVGVVGVPALAQAGGGGSERVRLTAADQALARASVATRLDLPQMNAWAHVPNNSSPVPTSVRACAPGRNLSRYVITGRAQDTYDYGVARADRDGESMFSSVTVFPTAANDLADWRATPVSYKTIDCLFEQLAKQPSSKVTLAAMSRLPLHAGAHTVAVRAHLRIAARGQEVPFSIDFLLFMVGRCQEEFGYSYIGDGNGSFVLVESLLLKQLVQKAVKAGCLRDGVA